jgi:hypothetical protein
MRDLIVTSALSRRLRGWFSAAGRPGEYVGRLDGASNTARGRRCPAPRAVTVEQMRDYWPLQTNDTTGITTTSTTSRSTSSPARCRTPGGSAPPCRET